MYSIHIIKISYKTFNLPRYVSNVVLWDKCLYVLSLIKRLRHFPKVCFSIARSEKENVVKWTSGSTDSLADLLKEIKEIV